MKIPIAATGLIVAFETCAALGQPSPGVIYACIGNNGSPQIVAAGTTCKKNESLVSWNITGPAGPRGPSNAYAADNSAAADGAVSTDPSLPTRLVTLSLPAGNYVLNGVAGLYASIDSGTLVPFANVGCALAASGGPVSATYRTLVGGKTISHASLPLVTTITLSSADTVAIDCAAESANGVAIGTQPSVLTAIQVDALSSQ